MDGLTFQILADSVSPSDQRLSTLLIKGSLLSLERLKSENLLASWKNTTLEGMLASAASWSGTGAYSCVHSDVMNAAFKIFEALPLTDHSATMTSYLEKLLSPFVERSVIITTSDLPHLGSLLGLTFESTPARVSYGDFHLPLLESACTEEDLVVLSQAQLSAFHGSPVSHVATPLELHSVYSRAEERSGFLVGWSTLP